MNKTNIGLRSLLALSQLLLGDLKRLSFLSIPISMERVARLENLTYTHTHTHKRR